MIRFFFIEMRIQSLSKEWLWWNGFMRLVSIKSRSFDMEERKKYQETSELKENVLWAVDESNQRADPIQCIYNTCVSCNKLVLWVWIFFCYKYISATNEQKIALRLDQNLRFNVIHSIFSIWNFCCAQYAFLCSALLQTMN